MGGIAGIELDERIDMHALVFKDTGRLLCHDDQLEHRRVAYILYLVEQGEADFIAVALGVTVPLCFPVFS